ncbi:L,D-transpeptidase family protein [Hutsoniella sourekii]
MKKTLTAAAITVIVLAVGYSAGIGYYADKFQANTRFANVDVSNLNLKEAEAKVADEINKQTIRITENGQEVGVLNIADLNPQIHAEETLQATYNSQNPNAWAAHYFTSENFDADLMENVTVDNEVLSSKLQEMGLTNEDRTPAQDAAINYSESQGYFVEEASEGNQLDTEKVKQAIMEGIQSGNDTVEINENYIKPSLTADSEPIQETMKQIDELKNLNITLKIDGQDVTIPHEEIEKWIQFDGNNQIVYDREAMDAYVGDLNKEYSSFYKTRQFPSTLQGTVSVQPGTLGWSIDRDSEVDQLVKDLNGRQDVTREPNIVGTGYSSNGDDIGDTYVEIDIANQQMFYYENGEQMLATAIVSGWANSTDTIPGAYAIWNKELNATLVGVNQQMGHAYRQPVSYWLPFDDTGQGIHDANWQANFGGDVYTYAGSQGCINTPPSVMAQLFDMVEVGTPVIIF